MLKTKIEGVDFIAANTDAQALKNLDVPMILQLGSSITRGLGAGANPAIGREAALEDRERIMELLAGADMVFVTAGMGGGTGTGAAPVVARTAKEMDILTVAIVTRPFKFERRDEVAESGLAELAECVDSLITIPNQRLLAVLGERTSMLNAFAAANDVLLGAVQGIAELITRPGLINVDFADVKTVMAEMGMAMMGTGTASGDNRACDAADAAIRSPLLEDVDLQGARGILVNVSAGPDPQHRRVRGRRQDGRGLRRRERPRGGGYGHRLDDGRRVARDHRCDGPWHRQAERGGGQHPGESGAVGRGILRGPRPAGLRAASAKVGRGRRCRRSEVRREAARHTGLSQKAGGLNSIPRWRVPFMEQNAYL